MTGTSFDMRLSWKVDNRIREILKGSFFHPHIDMVPYVQKTTFQSFIQDCYDKSSRTFTFGRDRKLELYLGLQNVFAISGFPVDEDLSPSKLNDVAWGAVALVMLHTSLGSDGRKNVNGPICIVESPRMVSPGKDSRKPKMKQFEFIRDEMTIEALSTMLPCSINDASLNSEIRDEDQETSPFCNDDQIDSINDASLNPEIRDDVGSSMSPKLKKRVIKVRPDLNVNIARGRDQKTPKSIFSPSGKKRKPHGHPV
nr:hypothetical protein [Tanacetum cinerariifolium]